MFSVDSSASTREAISRAAIERKINEIVTFGAWQQSVNRKLGLSFSESPAAHNFVERSRGPYWMVERDAVAEGFDPSTHSGALPTNAPRRPKFETIDAQGTHEQRGRPQ